MPSLRDVGAYATCLCEKTTNGRWIYVESPPLELHPELEHVDRASLVRSRRRRALMNQLLICDTFKPVFRIRLSFSSSSLYSTANGIQIQPHHTRQVSDTAVLPQCPIHRSAPHPTRCPCP